MKILYLLNSADLAGAETCFFRLIKELIKINGFECYVINQEEGILNDKLIGLGISVYVYPSIYVKKLYKVKEIKQIFKNIYFLRKIIKKEKPELIHAFTLPLARRVLFLRMIGIKTPVVGTIHDALYPAHFGKFKTKLFVYSINKYYKFLIAVSESTKKIASGQNVKAAKIIVIYNGIEVKESVEKRQNSSGNFTIGCFGRITPNKGQLVLLKTALILKDKIHNIKFLIIGKPSTGIKSLTEYHEELKIFVKDNCLQNNVEFIEWTNNIEQYYNLIDIYVLPSLIPDSFPTVNLEAMSFKIPVIASNIGGSKEQIENGITGILVEPNNAEQLAEKIVELYNNPKLRKKMGEHGYNKLLNDFPLGRWTKSHLDIYNKILKDKI